MPRSLYSTRQVATVLVVMGRTAAAEAPVRRTARVRESRDRSAFRCRAARRLAASSSAAATRTRTAIFTDLVCMTQGDMRWLGSRLVSAGPILRNFSGCTISKVHV